MSNKQGETHVHVAIIGGGSSGVLAAVNLILNFKATARQKTLSIAIVSDAPKVGRGAAYSTECPEHLLNVPAKGMSALVEQPEHFLDWLRRKRDESSAVEAETFARRTFYGEYMEELLHEAHRIRSGEVSLSIIQERADDMTVNGDTVTITLASGTSIHAHSVILALGNFAPANLPAVAGSIAALTLRSENYHANPWQHAGLKRIEPDEDVLLIGTGLTMVDVALELHAAGHRGRLLAVSRHGYLPRSHFGDERIRRENGTYYLPELLPTNMRKLFRTVRSACRLADGQQPGNWRFVFNELRQKTAIIWQSLDERNKKTFLRHVRQLWEVHRHRMANQICCTIEAMEKSGQLRVWAGRVIEIRSSSAGVNSIEVSIATRHGGDQQVKVQRVINCVGPQADLTRVQSNLVRSMLKKGIMIPDSLKLGAEASDNGVLIGADGKAIESIYAIGPLRKGQFWECTAIPDIRQQAKQVAETVLARISSEDFSAGGDASVSTVLFSTPTVAAPNKAITSAHADLTLR